MAYVSSYLSQYGWRFCLVNSSQACIWEAKDNTTRELVDNNEGQPTASTFSLDILPPELLTSNKMRLDRRVQLTGGI